MAKTYRHSESVRATVRGRAGGKCERCGLPFKRLYGPKGSPRSDASFHHRHKRQYGGRDSVANMVQVHLSCHKLLHNDEEWAEKYGLIMDFDRSTWTPALLCIKDVIGWYILNDDGSAERISGEMVRSVFERICTVPREPEVYRRQRHRMPVLN